MPVTLKLSRQFYDKFGDQVANEFVDAFNQVDATYRADLKELNESNFSRFDAKSDARFTQFDAKSDARFAQFDARFAEFEARFAKFEADLVSLVEDRIRGVYTFMLLGWAATIAAVIGTAIATK